MVIAKLLLVAPLLSGLPLFGAALAGRPVAAFLTFPPAPPELAMPTFSWPVFLLLLLFTLAITAPALALLARLPAFQKAPARLRPLPWWGWLGFALVAGGWFLAWTRFTWFSAFQTHTFAPLWLGFILLVNGLAWRRSGRSLLTHDTRYFLLLFPASAAFWWFFEFLNRFVRNWHYAGTAEFTGGQYVFFASLAFSTVLPAVLSTRAWLATFPALDAALRHGWAVRLRRPRRAAWLALALACLALAGIGAWPLYTFPFLWIAPLFVIVALQVLRGERTVFSGLPDGDWRGLVLPALAGLVCGFFWELWNYYSLARWTYTVPFVHGFEIFEMPLLGYAGYIPFGLECVAAAHFLLRPAPAQARIPAVQARAL